MQSGYPTPSPSHRPGWGSARTVPQADGPDAARPDAGSAAHRPLLDRAELSGGIVAGEQGTLLDEGRDDGPQALAHVGGVAFMTFGDGCCRTGQEVGELDGRVVDRVAADNAGDIGTAFPCQQGHADRSAGVLSHGPQGVVGEHLLFIGEDTDTADTTLPAAGRLGNCGDSISSCGNTGSAGSSWKVAA